MKISYIFGSSSDWAVYDKGLQLLIDAGFDVSVYRDNELVSLESSGLKLIKNDGGRLYLDGGGMDDLEPLCFRKDGVDVDFRCLSVHRVPDELHKYLVGFKPDVVVAGAGLTNVLANVCTEYAKVVIGVPVGGLDSFLSTVQTPPGYPIATVPVDRADVGVKIALNILGFKAKPMVYTHSAYADTDVTNILDKLEIRYEWKEVLSVSPWEQKELSDLNGFFIIGYNSPIELQKFESALKDSHAFIIGVNYGDYCSENNFGKYCKYCSEKFDGWMNGFSCLNNTVVVGNLRFENAAILAAQIVGLHDSQVLENIRNYREPGIKKYAKHLWSQDSKIPFKKSDNLEDKSFQNKGQD